MMFVAMTKPEEWNWATKRCFCMRMTDTQGVVVYDNAGHIKAAAVFDSFTVDACCFHMAIDNPLVIRDGFFNQIAEYLFITCNRDRVFCHIAGDNKKALRLARKAGFTQSAVVSDGRAKGVDLIIFRMDRDDNRWLDQKEEAA
jgi:hypothetical protein